MPCEKVHVCVHYVYNLLFRQQSEKYCICTFYFFDPPPASIWDFYVRLRIIFRYVCKRYIAFVNEYP